MRGKVGLVLAGLAAVGAYALLSSRRRGGSGESRPLEAGRDVSRDGWDEVDEASYQSFPASDPPSHNRVKI